MHKIGQNTANIECFIDTASEGFSVHTEDRHAVRLFCDFNVKLTIQTHINCDKAADELYVASLHFHGISRIYVFRLHRKFCVRVLEDLGCFIMSRHRLVGDDPCPGQQHLYNDLLHRAQYYCYYYR